MDRATANRHAFAPMWVIKADQAMAVAAERERCAKIAEDAESECDGYCGTRDAIAAKIRSGE